MSSRSGDGGAVREEVENLYASPVATDAVSEVLLRSFPPLGRSLLGLTCWPIAYVSVSLLLLVSGQHLFEWFMGAGSYNSPLYVDYWGAIYLLIAAYILAGGLGFPVVLLLWTFKRLTAKALVTSGLVLLFAFPACLLLFAWPTYSRYEDVDGSLFAELVFESVLCGLSALVATLLYAWWIAWITPIEPRFSIEVLDS